MKKVATLFINLLIGLLVLSGCNQQKNSDFLGSGTLEADDILVSTLLAGQIDSLYVSEGDLVEKSDPIAQINTGKLKVTLDQNSALQKEVQANIIAAKANADQLTRQHSNLTVKLQRQQTLFQTGNSTQQIIDELETQVVAAKSQRGSALAKISALKAKIEQLESASDLIQLQMKDGEITAPISGVIVESYLKSNEVAGLGSPICKLANLDQMEIKVYLSERDMGLVKSGQSVEVRVDALPDSPFDGKIVWISPRAEFTPRNVQTKEIRADLVFAIKVVFANPEQRALIGMPADVYLIP